MIQLRWLVDERGNKTLQFRTWGELPITGIEISSEPKWDAPRLSQEPAMGWSEWKDVPEHFAAVEPSNKE